jgi:hypothetical protein
MPHLTVSHGPAGPLIQVWVTISEARRQYLESAKLTPPTPILVNALIDTGASHTAVDPSVMAALNLSPRRIVHSITPSTGATPHKAYTYDVGIHVPIGGPVMHSQIAWEVTALDLKHQGFEMLFGRDLLSDALLIFDGKAGNFTLAF